MAEDALSVHKKLKGKIEIRSKAQLSNKKDLSLFYTPGVAEVSEAIAKDENLAYDYTMKGNACAIATDGSAVLGLGNIGPVASLPVMEGKAMLFKEFAGIDAVPLLFSQGPDLAEHIRSASHLFGAINLEDIAAPQCFEVEEALQDLGIPVMHDDQWGTAIVVCAAALNAFKATGKDISKTRIVINGAGAAGLAIQSMLSALGPEDIVMCDSKGIIYEGREGLNPYKEKAAAVTNKMKLKGGLEEAIKGSGMFIGVSKGGILKQDMVRSMEPEPIIFALANPVPEIMPDLAKAAGAAVVGTGRSDFCNQINNVLAFPGIFRGALDAKAERITVKMKTAAAYALAGCIDVPTREMIIPSPFDKSVVKKVSGAVKHAV